MRGISLHQECRKKMSKNSNLKKSNTKVQNVYFAYDLRSQCLEIFMSYSMGTNASTIGEMVDLYQFYL
jgi:hypothetical protein